MAEERPWSAEFRLNLRGSVRVLERGPESASGHYESMMQLVESNDQGVEIAFGYDADTGEIDLHLDFYHAENAETQRAFHAHVFADLPPTEISALRDFWFPDFTPQHAMTAARYFLLRRVRFGPLVPARLVEIAHEPGEPDNTRDRWPPFVTCADIAGEVVPPEELTERFFWPKSHWKWAEPVDEATYRYHFERLRRAETADPQSPLLRSKKRVDPAAVALPSFERENQL